MSAESVYFKPQKVIFPDYRSEAAIPVTNSSVFPENFNGSTALRSTVANPNASNNDEYFFGARTKASSLHDTAPNNADTVQRPPVSHTAFPTSSGAFNTAFKMQYGGYENMQTQPLPYAYDFTVYPAKNSPENGHTAFPFQVSPVEQGEMPSSSFRDAGGPSTAPETMQDYGRPRSAPPPERRPEAVSNAPPAEKPVVSNPIMDSMLRRDTAAQHSINALYERRVSEANLAMEHLKVCRMRHESARNYLQGLESQLLKSRGVALAELKAKFAALQAELQTHFNRAASDLDAAHEQEAQPLQADVNVINYQIQEIDRALEMLHLKFKVESKAQFVANFRVVMQEVEKALALKAPRVAQTGEETDPGRKVLAGFMNLRIVHLMPRQEAPAATAQQPPPAAVAQPPPREGYQEKARHHQPRESSGNQAESVSSNQQSQSNGRSQQSSSSEDRHHRGARQPSKTRRRHESAAKSTLDRSLEVQRLDRGVRDHERDQSRHRGDRGGNGGGNRSSVSSFTREQEEDKDRIIRELTQSYKELETLYTWMSKNPPRAQQEASPHKADFNQEGVRRHEDFRNINQDHENSPARMSGERSLLSKLERLEEMIVETSRRPSRYGDASSRSPPRHSDPGPSQRYSDSGEVDKGKRSQARTVPFDENYNPNSSMHADSRPNGSRRASARVEDEYRDHRTEQSFSNSRYEADRVQKLDDGAHRREYREYGGTSNQRAPS